MGRVLGLRDAASQGVALLYCVLLATFTTAQKTGYCQFPEFLWEAAQGNRDPVWVTRTEYINISSDWTQEEEIKVNPADIIVTVSRRESCRDSRHTTCEDKRVYETAICLSEEPDGKYRVKIDRKGKELFTCVKFIRRNANIVQLWAAQEQTINEDKLCYENSLERVPWPWIAREKTEWSFCPIVGGFDFKAKLPLERKNVCSRQWRPSRLESECIKGEGILFSFPEDRCSIFPKAYLSPKLYCWGSWTEDEYTFIILGRESRIPQYTLRIPKDMTATAGREYTAYMYYSPVCPMRNRGRPPGKVTYAELTMTTSPKGVCYDESPDCAELVVKGKCTNEALHKFASYCKKSCGLCDGGGIATNTIDWGWEDTGPSHQNLLNGGMADFVPSVVSECKFHKDWWGDWLWAESGALQDVTIGTGQVSFSHLGTFLCKNRHWDSHKYKMMSHFSNGCRPRYTCMQFRREGKLIRFQISKSDTADRSFDLCTFEDDPQPLGNQIRSSSMKVLLPKSRTTFNSCGLLGHLDINVTFPFESSCGGTVNDWDRRKCKPKPILSLSVYPCSHFDWKDYVCVAHTRVSDNYSTVLTRAGDSTHLPLQCWVVHTTYNRRLQREVWSDARLLDTGQCGHEDTDRQVSVGRGARLEFTRTSDNIESTCYDAQWPHFTKTNKPPIHSEQERNKQTTFDSDSNLSVERSTILPKTTLEKTRHQDSRLDRGNLPDSSGHRSDRSDIAKVQGSSCTLQHPMWALLASFIVSVFSVCR